jgi:putative membrane protein
MKSSPYLKFSEGDLSLRDELAVDRTALANERTLLAYLRSAVALLIAGVSIVHFSQKGWFWAFGIACLPVGIITGLIGALRYQRMSRSISFARRQREKGAEKKQIMRNDHRALTPKDGR